MLQSFVDVSKNGWISIKKKKKERKVIDHGTFAKKKNPFVANHSLRKIKSLNIKEEKKIIVTWSQASVIVPAMIGHTIVVHNGREPLPIYVTDHMVDHKLGEFAPTLLFQGHARNDKKYCR
jgi:small subunit ribosomal protein S19